MEAIYEEVFVIMMEVNDPNGPPYNPMVAQRGHFRSILKWKFHDKMEFSILR